MFVEKFVTRIDSFIKEKRIREYLNFWRETWKLVSHLAASLAYFTVVGLVPLCASFIFISEATHTPIHFSPILSFILPDFKDSFNTFHEAALTQNSEWFTDLGALGIVAVVMIMLFTYFFISNVQNASNEIWKSKDRGIVQSILFSFVSLLILFSLSLVYSLLFDWLHTDSLKRALTVITVTIIIALSYKFIPYDKRPRTVPVVLSAVITSIALILFAKLLPYAISNLKQTTFGGIQILLFVFWLYWSWIIILLGAVLCRVFDKSGYILHLEIADLATNYRVFLTLHVASHIFRRFYEDSDARWGLSFNQVRQGMFEYEENGEKINSKVCLPMPLLDEIINKLVHCKIIDKKVINNEVRYSPKLMDSSLGYKNIPDYTVGDIMCMLDFNGGYVLDKDYWKLKIPFFAKFNENLMKAYSLEPFDMKLVDFKPDKDLESPKDVETHDVSGESQDIQIVKYKQLKEKYSKKSASVESLSESDAQLRDYFIRYHESGRSYEELKQGLINIGTEESQHQIDILDKLIQEQRLSSVSQVLAQNNSVPR